MKKLMAIAGAILIFSVFLGLVLWMGEDEKLKELAEKVKSGRERGPEKIPKNLEKLAEIKGQEFPKYKDRIVLSENLLPLTKLPEKIELLNIAEPDWDKKTISNLNESSDFDRKISITKKRSLIALNKENGIYLEQAEIIFTQRDGTRGSFEALINSETGSIEMVISKNINESIEEPDVQVKSPDSKVNPFANSASPEEAKELNEGNTENILENLNQEKLADFDAQEYEDEIKEQERILKEQNSDANYKKYVQELKRQISSEN